MIRCAVVLLLVSFVSFSSFAQEIPKKAYRPDIPGSFVFDLGVNRGRIVPANFRQGLWGSRTVNLYYQYPVQILKSKFSFVPSIGIGLERFKLINNYTLSPLKDPDGSYPLVPSSTIHPGTYKSMIISNYFDGMIGFRFDTHPEDIPRSFSLTVGGRAGLMYDGYTKLKYKEDGETKVVKDKQNHGLNPYRYGLYTRVGIGGFNFFTYYNITPLFLKNKGPQLTQMNTLTFGISINGF